MGELLLILGSGFFSCSLLAHHVVLVCAFLSFFLFFCKNLLSLCVAVL